MIEAEIILWTKRKTKLGYPIKIRVYQNRDYKYIPLKEYQNSKKLTLNSKIIKRMAELENEVEYCNNMNLGFEESLAIIKNGIPDDKELEIFKLKQRLAELQNESGMGLIEFFDIRINELKEESLPTSAYEQTKIQIQQFIAADDIEDIMMNNIDYELLQKFIRYKKITTKKGEGGINTYLKNIRAVYKEAQKRDSLNIKKDNPFLGLITNSTKKEVIDIPQDDILKLFSQIEIYNSFINKTTKLESNKGMTRKSAYTRVRAIELWLFQISIGGFDFADIAQLTWGNIRNNRVVFKRYKNRNKPNGGELVNNMLSEYAKGIVNKYGDKNNEKLFSFIPDPSSEKRYKTFRDNINDILFRVSETLNFEERIRTKSPRYIFRSLAGDLLIDTLAVMQIQGHKPEGVTYKYQRKLKHEVIDEQHKRVLDLIFLDDYDVLKPD